MPEKVYIIGVGMTEFLAPRNRFSYEELGLEAAVKALLDADLTYDSVDQAVAGYVYGDSTCGQRVLYQLGLTGVPVYNVNNNCATGSTALYMARQFVRSGQANVVLALGFEKMEPGSLGSKYKDRTDPLERFAVSMHNNEGIAASSLACQFFANAGTEYIAQNCKGAEPSQDELDVLARIAEVNHAHSVNNPYSQFKKRFSLDQIKNSAGIHKTTTKLQCCPTSDGAAAAVVVSGGYLAAHPHLRPYAVEIVDQELRTDTASVFSGSSIDLVGRGMTRAAAAAIYKRTGVDPAKDVQVVELHDCFAANELCALDALGICPPGGAIDLVNSGGLTYANNGGRTKRVVNPSGGLISKGHPLGATGLAQAAELVWHLRGWASNRSVPGTRYCLQHNLGLGGCVVLSLYQRADGQLAPENAGDGMGQEGDGRRRLGYNPALEARHVTKEQMGKAVSQKCSDKFTYEGNRLAGIEPSAKI